MCQSENFWHIVVGILRRISPFQRSAALGGPFFCALFFRVGCARFRRLLDPFQETLVAFVRGCTWPLEDCAAFKLLPCAGCTARIDWVWL